jgi:hypothetical protein
MWLFIDGVVIQSIHAVLTTSTVDSRFYNLNIRGLVLAFSDLYRSLSRLVFARLCSSAK